MFYRNTHQVTKSLSLNCSPTNKKFKYDHVAKRQPQIACSFFTKTKLGTVPREIFDVLVCSQHSVFISLQLGGKCLLRGCIFWVDLFLSTRETKGGLVRSDFKLWLALWRSSSVLGKDGTLLWLIKNYHLHCIFQGRFSSVRSSSDLNLLILNSSCLTDKGASLKWEKMFQSRILLMLN